jgi:hypothetical protein
VGEWRLWGSGSDDLQSEGSDHLLRRPADAAPDLDRFELGRQVAAADVLVEGRGRAYP